MLSITGLFKDELVENKLITAQQAIELFDLPFEIGERVRLRVLKKHIKKDRSGQERYANRRLIPSFVQGVYKRNQYSVRYYTSKVERPASQNSNAHVDFSPKYLEFGGKIHDIDTVLDAERAVMLMLSIKCINGPFYNNRVDAEYEYVDTQAEAKKAFDQELHITKALEFFKKSKDTHKIERVALGFIIPGQGLVNRSELGSDIERRMAMINLAKTHAKAVSDALTDPVTLTRGAIHQAIDGGLIKLHPAAGGSATYKWSDGTVLLQVRSSANAFDTLLKHVLSPDVHDTFFSALQSNGVIKEVNDLGKELVDAGKGEAAAVPIDLTDPFVLIVEAEKAGRIVLETSDMKVRFVKEDGTIQKQFPLGAVESLTDWKEEIAEKVKDNSTALGRLRKLVATGLQNK